MSEDKKVSVSVSTLKEIKNTLEEIKIMSTNNSVVERVSYLLQIISDSDKNLNMSVSLEEMIHAKMKEVRARDLDLHSKLYILYRNLTDGKISEEDARSKYETYLRMEDYNKMVY